MINYHLTITIFNSFFEGKLNSRGRIESVRFNDYDILIEKIFLEMSWSDINKFKLNLFNMYKYELSCIRVSQLIDGNVTNGYSIVSQDFNVPANIIAICLPNRKIRDKYFEYDGLREKYFVKTDFIYYLKK